MDNPQAMKTGPLMEEYRALLLLLGGRRVIGHQSADAAEKTKELSKRADALEAEISRRIAWG